MSSNEVLGGKEVVKLEGFVDEQAFLPLSNWLREQTRERPGWHYVLDCARVTSFSGKALADLGKVIEEVRCLGSTVVLVNLSKRIQDTMVDRLLETFAHPALVEPLLELVELERARSRNSGCRQVSVN